MTRYVVQAPDGSRHIIEGPDQPTAPQQPQGADQGGLMSAVEGFANAATFGLDKPVEAAIGSAVHGIPYAQARANMDANETATQTAHPYASVAGNVAGLVPGAGVGGAVLRSAEAVPVIGRAAAAVRAAPTIPRVAATIATDSAIGAGTGYAQGGKPGAIAGAIAGPLARPIASTAGAVAEGILKGPAAAAYRVLAKTVMLPGETLSQATQRLATTATEYQQTFGHMPALAELVDQTQAKEISSTIGRRAAASQNAASLEDQAAVARQGDVSGAIATSRPSATAAQGDVEAAARKGLDTTMSKIDQTRVTPTAAQSVFLTENAPHIRAVMRGTSYNDARSALEDHLDQGTPPTLRNVEDMRLAASRGARSTDPVVAHQYAEIRDGLRDIGENVPEYKQAMSDYAHTMRFGENIPEGAKGMTAPPKDFAAGFTHQPEGTIGDAARAGQTVGLRTALSQKALQSPNATVKLAQDVNENAALRQNIDTAFQPAEAARIKSIGEQSTRAARGMAAAVPAQRTEAQEAADTSSHALRASLLGVHGGSSSYMSHNIEWLVTRAGLPLGTAKKVSELAMDPRNTPAVLQYLKLRGTTATQRHEFMDLVRSGAAASVGSLAGQAAAGAYPQ